jgi:hypothetical protein
MMFDVSSDRAKAVFVSAVGIFCQILSSLHAAVFSVQQNLDGLRDGPYYG